MNIFSTPEQQLLLNKNINPIRTSFTVCTIVSVFTSCQSTKRCYLLNCSWWPATSVHELAYNVIRTFIRYLPYSVYVLFLSSWYICT